jgi:hypothetical protein
VIMVVIEIGTRRPLIVNMVNNIDAEEPKITIKRDVLGANQGSEDLNISLDDILEEIQKRNALKVANSTKISHFSGNQRSSHSSEI